jgi:hypothetical protein
LNEELRDLEGEPEFSTGGVLARPCAEFNEPASCDDLALVLLLLLLLELL